MASALTDIRAAGTYNFGKIDASLHTSAISYAIVNSHEAFGPSLRLLRASAAAFGVAASPVLPTLVPPWFFSRLRLPKNTTLRFKVLLTTTHKVALSSPVVQPCLTSPSQSEVMRSQFLANTSTMHLCQLAVRRALVVSRAMRVLVR